MRRMQPTLAVVAMAVLFGACVASAAELHLATLRWEIDTATGQVAAIGAPDAPRGGVRIFDGRADGPCELSISAATPQADGIELTAREAAGDLLVRQRIVQHADHVMWSVTLENAGDEERWLQVALALPAPLTDGSFWDGQLETPLSAGDRQAGGLVFWFPAAAVYDAERGLVVGIEPSQVFSFLGSAVEVADDASVLSFSARIVLPPGAGETVEFFAAEFAGRWGRRDAVQRTYDLFPAAWWPAEDIDPRIVGPGRYLRGSNANRDLQIEQARRLLIGWDWAYAPFQTPGDWYPDERFWDDAKGHPGSLDKHYNAAQGTLEDYRRETRIRCHEGRRAAAILFYVLPQQCEWSLLEEAFPDSFWVWPDGSHPGPRQGWIKTDANPALAMPWNTSYGQETLRDFARILEDFRPSGFAFDTCHGGRRYYGPAQEGMRGRAWDQYGSFVDESVALSNLLDWVHDQQVEGLRAGTCLNGPHVYTLGRRADCVMFEPSPLRYTNYRARQWPVRLLAGHKPLVWHKGYPYWLNEMVRWQELEAEQIQEAFRGMLDYTLLRSLVMGAIPSNDFWGVPRMVEWGRILTGLCRAGWQPVPALSADERLWAARYGEGTRSVLVLCNPTREVVSADVAVEARYLGPGSYIACGYEGGRVDCTFDADATNFTATIEPHGAGLWQAALRLLADGPLSGRGWLEVPDTRDGRFSIRASIHLDAPAQARVRLAIPKGAAVEGVAVNRAPVEWRLVDGAVEFDAALQAHNTLVVASWPRVLIPDAQAVLDFPFMAEGEPDCTIVIPDDASEAERFAAERLAVYFDYYYRRQQHPSGVVWELDDVPGLEILVVAADAPAATGHVVMIGRSEDSLIAPHCVQLQETLAEALIARRPDGERDVLAIAGRSDAALAAAMDELVALLDERYPYCGVMGDGEVYQKAELDGRVLDW